MKLSFLILIFIVTRICHSQNVTFQTNRDLLFNNNSYDVMIIKVDKGLYSKLSIFENTQNSTHSNLMNNINPDSSSFFIGLGISEQNCLPVGCLIENQKLINAINKNDGEGNFYLKPNGGILIGLDYIKICETSKIEQFSSSAIWGYQSGPLLLESGILNAQFKEASTNKQYRSAIGIFRNTQNEEYVIFCASTVPVNFYAISIFLKDNYKCDNALLLGSVNCAMAFPYDFHNNSSINAAGNIFCRYIKYTP